MTHTEDAREVEEAEGQGADQSWTCKRQTIVQVDQLRQSARQQSSDEEPALKVLKLVGALPGPIILQRNDEQLYRRFGEDERHAA